MNGYLITLLVLLIYFAIVIYLKKTKWLEKHSMSLFGPFVMWRTRRGRQFVDRLAAPKRFWTAYSIISLWVCAAAMMLIMLLLLWEATIVSRVEEPPSPELILGIPGLNPVIPVGYGILGLVVAIVVHELAHGVVTRLGGLRLQSMGLLFLVVPMGAFVEPDEEELRATTRRKRSRVFAAGPATNILLALVFLGLFSGVMMASVAPATDGALAIGAVEGSPASRAGIAPGSVVLSIGGEEVVDATAWEERASPAPGSLVEIAYVFGGDHGTATVVDGVVIAYVVEGFAGHTYGLRTGMVIVSLDDTPVRNVEAFSDIMSGTRSGQTVNVTAMEYVDETGEFEVASSVTEIVLSNKYDYYAEYDPDDNDPSYDGVGYLGVGALDLGLDVRDVDFYSGLLSNPFEGDKDFSDFSMSWLRLIALPFLDLAPVRAPITDLYEPAGSMAWMPDTLFWLVANSLYWIFWLNLMVGLTNVLPAVPLDGGYLFKDAVDYLLSRTGRSYTQAQRDRIVSSLTAAFAFIVLGLILWQLVGPAL